jgi:hypothetical protein
MPKGFREKCQVGLLNRKDFLAVERDVGESSETVLRKIPSMSRGPRLGGGGTVTRSRLDIKATISQGMLVAMITD